jgi:hypothetical protein
MTVFALMLYGDSFEYFDGWARLARISATEKNTAVK